MPKPPERSSDEPLPAGTALAPPAAVTWLASFVSEIAILVLEEGTYVNTSLRSQ